MCSFYDLMQGFSHVLRQAKGYHRVMTNDAHTATITTDIENLCVASYPKAIFVVYGEWVNQVIVSDWHLFL
jgi:uncharacterized protein YdbL (DUF1318 family)